MTVRDRDGGTHAFYWDVVAWQFSRDPGVYCGGFACTTGGPCGGPPPVGDLLREAQDRVDELFVEVVDPVFCAAVPLVLGEPGIVSAAPEGDVFVNGELVWDCPPYQG